MSFTRGNIKARLRAQAERAAACWHGRSLPSTQKVPLGNPAARWMFSERSFLGFMADSSCLGGGAGFAGDRFISRANDGQPWLGHEVEALASLCI